MKFGFRTMLLACGLALVGANAGGSSVARADIASQSTIQIVVPFNPGGSTL